MSAEIEVLYFYQKTNLYSTSKLQEWNLRQSNVSSV